MRRQTQGGIKMPRKKRKKEEDRRKQGTVVLVWSPSGEKDGGVPKANQKKAGAVSGRAKNRKERNTKSGERNMRKLIV